MSRHEFQSKEPGLLGTSRSENPVGIHKGGDALCRRPEERAWLPFAIPSLSLDCRPLGASITSGFPERGRHTRTRRGYQGLPGGPSSTRAAWGPLTARGLGRCRHHPGGTRQPCATGLLWPAPRPQRPRPAPPRRSPHSSRGRTHQSPRTNSAASGDGAGPREARSPPPLLELAPGSGHSRAMTRPRPRADPAWGRRVGAEEALS